MKSFLKFFIAFAGFLLMTAPAANAVGQALHVSAGAVQLAFTATAILTYKYVTSGPMIHVAGVEREIWVNYIIQRLWKDNQFLLHAYNDDQYVLAGKIVHIPQPGSKPTVVKNRSSFPATAVGRTDTDIMYMLDVYTTDPTHIQDAEKIEPSYDKIDSVFGDHAGALAETIADDMIIKWLTNIASGSKMLTSGAATAATAPDATGNRKAFTIEDLRKSMKGMNKTNVPKNDRFALVSSESMDQLTSSLSATQYRDFSQHYDAAKGIVGKLYGFDIIERSSVAVANSSNVVKALGAAGATTDGEVTLLWQKDAVARALGETKFFENTDDPQFYGDVYSGLVRMGGRRRRSDDLGIIMLNQDTAA